VKTASSVFYKFRAYNPSAPKELGWVPDTIFAKWIRFARTSELNDPFEGRPSLVPRHKDPAEQRAAIFQAVLDGAHREGLTGDAAIAQAEWPPRAIHAESPGFSAATPHGFTRSCSQIRRFHDNPHVQCDCERDFNTKYHEAPPIVTHQLRL
jgi:hypothetical protein